MQHTSEKSKAVKMDVLLSLLVFSALPQFVVPDVPTVVDYQPVIEMVTGMTRAFSGENIHLRCSVPNDKRSTWRFMWFKENELLTESESLYLFNINSRHSGKYFCKGLRSTVIGLLYTMESKPIEIYVDVGWVILNVSPNPSLVGETLKATCQTRHNLLIAEVALYKDDVEVLRQEGSNLHFQLTNVTLRNQGRYSCRATWNKRSRSYSAVSLNTEVIVKEVLTKPTLVVSKNPMDPVDMMRISCHFQYNARAPAPPVHLYYYKNGKKMGPASNKESIIVNQTPVNYSCKARVPEMGLIRWSDPKSFGMTVIGRFPPRRKEVPARSPQVPQTTVGSLRHVQSTDQPLLPEEATHLNNQTAVLEATEMSGDLPDL